MSVSKRKQGQRLNKAGRLSPLEVMQERMEHFQQLAAEEKGKGEAASKEKIATYLAAAQNAAEALAPYRHPRLQSTTTDVTVRSAVLRAPELCETNEDWIQKHVPRDLRPPTTIEGEVTASTTSASSPVPAPAPSTALQRFDPDAWRLELIANRYFSLKAVSDPRP